MVDLLDASQDEPSPDESLKPENIEAAEEEQQKRFGTFGGVFTPTVLTILGVILFLRVGWVVGNAGLGGAILIIFVGFGITTCTALAMSSITTNIRIGTGGAYAIIAQSLGLEVGGAVGIPRYLSQALAVTMYIFGVRAGWLYLFPDHPSLLVDLGVFALLFLIAYVSADFAIKIQYLIMMVILGALVSIGVAAGTGSLEYGLSDVQLWGDFVGSPENNFGGSSFWVVFAVFFPATTGIMAGANMSGDLKDPKTSIPSGTLWAIGVSMVIYILLAVWLALSASTEELLNNYTVAIDKAYWPRAVLAGLLGATFSSALASLVGAARILQAMGEHHIVPRDDWLAKLSENAEPRHALFVTGGLILLSIMVRDLNAIAPFITMFFLVTYAMICGAVLIEQSLDMVSFRPLIRIPLWVSFLGLLGSLIAMFIINPTVSLISLAVTVGFYFYLANRRLDAPFEDVRSGLFEAFAEWAAQKVTGLPEMQERAWKPKVLVPLDEELDVPGSFELLRNLTYPNGYLSLVYITPDWLEGELNYDFDHLGGRFRNSGVFTRASIIEGSDYFEGIMNSLVLSGGFFGPNILFMDLSKDRPGDDEVRKILRKAQHSSLGIYLFVPARSWESGGRSLNVWVSDMSPDWDPENLPVSLDLSLLTGHILQKNWNAAMRVVCGVSDQDQVDTGHLFLENYLRQARFPEADLHVNHGSLDRIIRHTPRADLNIFGLPQDFEDFGFMRDLVEETESACLFVKGSGDENALA